MKPRLGNLKPKNYGKLSILWKWKYADKTLREKKLRLFKDFLGYLGKIKYL